MKIKRILAGLSAAMIAAMTTAALSASATIAAPAPGSGAEKLAKENSKSVIARSISRGISDGSVISRRDTTFAQEPLTQDIPLLVLVIEFPNVQYNTTLDWNNQMFVDEYSLSQFYTDMSGGKFTFTPVEETSAYDGDLNRNEADKENDGVIHVTVSQEHGNWSDLNATSDEFIAAFKEGLEIAGDYVDFAQYDVNGDGALQNEELSLGIVVAGYDSTYTGDDEGNDDFWPHQWNFGASDLGAPVVDGVEFGDYIAAAETYREGLYAGTDSFSHELGHFLGLPDYYDTEYMEGEEWNGYTTGMLSTMDSGTWGTSADFSRYIPFAFDPVSKMILGWGNFETVTEEGTYEVVAEDYYTEGTQEKCLIIPTQNDGEFYVLQVRDYTKWDEGLKYHVPAACSDGGIVMYHVDKNVWDEPSETYNNQSDNGWCNTINVPTHRPGLTTNFVEMDEDNYATFIGDIAYDASLPIPAGDAAGNEDYWPINIYSKSMWEYYTSGSLGEAVKLPKYGTGLSKNIRSARTLSGINVEFLDDASSTMHVKITYVDPETDDSSSEPEVDSSSEVESSTPDSSSVADSSVAPVDTTSSKLTNTAVANTGAGAGLGAVAAVVAGALITVVSRKRKNTEEV